MQHKGWSIFFGAVLLASFLLCAVAPFVNGWWLPDNVSSYGPDVDRLYYIILAFTGFFFVLTEALLVYAMYRFAGRPGGRSDYVEGNHRLEMLWTIVPAGILIYIAVAQINTWEQIKYQAQMPQPDLVMQVMARQWDWSMRYANAPPKNPRMWAEVPEIDDIYVPDEIHCWKDANVRIYLKTQDVLHSLFLPQLRLKQDALPGKTIPMWFKATDFNAKFNETTGKCDLEKGKEWEIACAELCGGGHYRMRGLLFVHESEKDYLKWFEHAKAAARSRQSEKRMPAVAVNE